MTANLEPRIAGLAESLLAAERTRSPLPPFSISEAGFDAAGAYAIQRRIVDHRLAAGETIVGWKIGLTSKAMQEQLGVAEPDYAPILSDWCLRDGAAIETDGLIQPRAEAEIAFHLARPLRGPGVTVSDVLEATSWVSPAIEVIDSRIEAWKIRLPDTIADMASSARVILGSAKVAASDLALPEVAVSFQRNGEEVANGLGSAVLGDPAAAVAWAANTLSALGVTLEAHHVIMPGAMHASVAVSAGDTFRATFEGLGTVAVGFTSISSKRASSR